MGFYEEAMVQINLGEIWDLGSMSRSFESGIKNLADAYVMWKFLAKKPNNGNSTNEFFHFLGIERDSKELTQEANDKINWLLSPHAETLYKAWKIKRG